MSEVFTKYPELTDVTTESDSNIGLTQAQCEILAKNVKKIAKLHKKQFKKLRKIHKIHKVYKLYVKKSSLGVEVPADREAITDKETFTSKETFPNKEDNRTKVTEKKEKTFLGRLGDAVLKAFPSILRIVTTTVVSAIFGRGFKWFGSRKLGIT